MPQKGFLPGWKVKCSVGPVVTSYMIFPFLILRMDPYQEVSAEAQSHSESKSEEPNDLESTEYPFIPVVSVEAKWLGPLLAVFLQTAVIAVSLTTTFCGVYLRHPGLLSTKDQFLYITGITILASLVTSYTIGITRKLWVARLIVGEPSAISFPAQQRRQASTAIGLARFKHQLQSWHISLSFLIMGLGTASIVASLSPRIVSGKVTGSQESTLLTAA